MKLLASIEIDRPASELWRVVGDYGQDVRWRGEVLGMSSEPPGPVELGTTVVERARFMGVTMNTPGEVVDVTGRSFRWRTRSGLEFTGQREVVDVSPERSRVTLIMEGRFAGPMRILEPLVGLTMRRRMAANLDQLRGLFAVHSVGGMEPRANDQPSRP